MIIGTLDLQIPFIATLGLERVILKEKVLFENGRSLPQEKVLFVSFTNTAMADSRYVQIRQSIRD
jgi:hypothetical protein